MLFAIVVYMRDFLTITNKGQTTLPVAIRKKLGIPSTGGVLHVAFNEQRREVIITKPITIDELSEKISRYIKPDIKPLTDADTYYQTHRKGRK
jgi:bifunctional DNA-binding transcriptional regulator/antitoxin component of YhaV-PrlF toxin-antitoxin module